MNCPQCGNAVNKNDKFCGACGHRIINENEPPQETNNASATFDLLFEAQVNENKNAVFQKDEERLFLDDDDAENSAPESPDDFFAHLRSLDVSEKISKEELMKEPTIQKTKNIEPVFEAIPNLPEAEPETKPKVKSETLEENKDDQQEVINNSEDDYSEIVLEGPMQFQPESIESQTEEPILESEATPFAESASETPINNEPTSCEKDTCISNEPLLLIDNNMDSPSEPQEGEYNVNLQENAQSSYLDNFLPKFETNINFDFPANNPENETEESLKGNSEEEMEKEETDTKECIEAPPIISESPAKPKVKKSKIILTGLSIVLLIGLLIGSLFLFKDVLFKEKDDNFKTNPSSTTSLILPENKNPETPTSISTPTDTDEGAPIPKWEIVKSDYETPAKLGQASIVAKYLDDKKVYNDVQIKVNKIHRGEYASQLAKEYENSSNVIFETLPDGIEYVVVEYEVYIPKDVETQSTTTNIPLEVVSKSSNSVMYNNNSYIISTWCIDKGENASTNSVKTCKEIFQMPKGCSDYLLVFGTEGYSTAIFKGE